MLTSSCILVIEHSVFQLLDKALITAVEKIVETAVEKSVDKAVKEVVKEAMKNTVDEIVQTSAKIATQEISGRSSEPHSVKLQFAKRPRRIIQQHDR